MSRFGQRKTAARSSCSPGWSQSVIAGDQQYACLFGSVVKFNEIFDLKYFTKYFTNFTTCFKKVR